MRAISLWQPYASLWLSTAKAHETRHWATDYRGPLAVHAAKRMDRVSQYVNDICVRQFGSRWQFDLPRGAVIGTLELIDCVSTNNLRAVDPEDYACGNFAAGRYGWKRGAFHVLPHSIPFIGRQGFFNVPDDLLANPAGAARINQ